MHDHRNLKPYIYIYIYIYKVHSLWGRFKCLGIQKLSYRAVWSWYMADSVVIRLQAGQRTSRFFRLQAGSKNVQLFQNNQNGASSHSRPLLQWEPVAKRPSREDRYWLHHTLASLKIGGATPPHVHKNSWHIHGQLYLHLTQRILSYKNAFKDVMN